MSLILLDNGHGIDTPGKCSPDKSFLEYSFAREIVAKLHIKLTDEGYNSRILVPEPVDISLNERVKRANSFAKRNSGTILISIHANAAGNKGWNHAGGWSAYTSKGSTKADLLSEYLYKNAEIYLKDYIDRFKEYTQKNAYDQSLGEEYYGSSQKPIRTDLSDGDKDFEENFYLLKNTICPAVLTENLFQDNRLDVEFLNSEEGRLSIVNLHFAGITQYLNHGVY